MSKPTHDPTWATDTGASITDPGSTKQADGWVADERPPAHYFNWWMNLIGDYVDFFRGFLDSNEEHTYSSAKSRTVRLSPVNGWAYGPTPEWSLQSNGLDSEIPAAWSESDFGRLAFDLSAHLPTDATLTRVRALVHPGTAGSSGEEMELRVRHYFNDWVTPARDDGTFADVGTDDESDGTTDLQTLDIGAISQDVDLSQGNLVAYILAGNNGGTNSDTVYELEVQFDDPGPRNY